MSSVIHCWIYSQRHGIYLWIRNAVLIMWSFFFSDLGAHGEAVTNLSVQTFAGNSTMGTATTELHTVSCLSLQLSFILNTNWKDATVQYGYPIDVRFCFQLSKKRLLKHRNWLACVVVCNSCEIFSVNLKARHLVIPTFAHAQTFDRSVYV